MNFLSKTAHFVKISNFLVLVVLPYEKTRIRVLVFSLLSYNLLLDGILILDSVDLSIDGILITKIIMLDRLKIIIQFVDKRDTSRNVESSDIFIVDVVKILDKSS